WVAASGKVDNEGWLIGQWKVNKQGLMVDFINGVDLFDPKDKELTELQRKVATLPEEERENFCLENDLTMEIKSGENFFDLNDGYFDNGMWLHRKITGDKTYKSEDGLNYKDSREYGKYIIIDRKKTRDLKSIDNYWTSKSSTGMRKMLEDRKNELSKDDQQILSDAIKSREIMEKTYSEYAKSMDYYRSLRDFKTPNSVYMLPNLMTIYKDIEANAKSSLNVAINADALSKIDIAIFEVRTGITTGLKPYSAAVDYGAYLEKVKHIAPVLNTLPDSLKAITSLHDYLHTCSKVIRNEFTSNHLKPLLRSVLDNYVKEAVPTLKNMTTLSEALSYTKSMAQASVALSNLDKQHIVIEKGLVKPISIGSNASALLSSALSSSQNKLIITYYSIAEQVLGQLALQFDYKTLSDLYEVAKKVESLKDTNTKILEKELKKEPDINRKMQMILAQ
ncbi:MAG: hypothetical protein R3Y51_07945, partial [Rikenellaceae bacterium]